MAAVTANASDRGAEAMTAIATDSTRPFVARGQVVIGDHKTISIGEEMRALLRLSEGKTAEEMENRLELLSNWT